jgi:hypothetical protein
MLLRDCGGVAGTPEDLNGGTLSIEFLHSFGGLAKPNAIVALGEATILGCPVYLWAAAYSLYFSATCASL